MADTMFVKEAAKLWDISERRVSTLCKEGKIKGAKKRTVTSAPGFGVGTGVAVGVTASVTSGVAAGCSAPHPVNILPISVIIKSVAVIFRFTKIPPVSLFFLRCFLSLSANLRPADTFCQAVA